MTVIPENGTVLCEVVEAAKRETTECGISYEKEGVPLYVVVSVSSGSSFSPGDVVICNSTGTRLCLPGKVQFLFKEENVVGKVKD